MMGVSKGRCPVLRMMPQHQHPESSRGAPPKQSEAPKLYEAALEFFKSFCGRAGGSIAVSMWLRGGRSLAAPPQNRLVLASARAASPLIGSPRRRGVDDRVFTSQVRRNDYVTSQFRGTFLIRGVMGLYFFRGVGTITIQGECKVFRRWVIKVRAGDLGLMSGWRFWFAKVPEFRRDCRREL